MQLFQQVLKKSVSSQIIESVDLETLTTAAPVLGLPLGMDS